MSETQLPEGWIWRGIEDIISDPKRGLKTGPFGMALTKADHRKDGIPVLGIENIGRGIFLDGNKIFISTLKALELTSYQVKAGDLIISRSGTVGEICVVPERMEGSLISTNLIRVSLNQRSVFPQYFCYLFLGCQSVLMDVKELCKGSSRAFLNQEILKSLNFPLPPLPIQRQIVARIEELFSELDAGVAELKTALARLKTYRQAVLHHYLNNPNWERVLSGNLFDYVTSGSRGWAQFYSNEGAIFLRITNLDFNTLKLDLQQSKIQYVNLTGAKEGLRTRVKSGDFLISITGYLGMLAIVPDDIPEAYVNQHIALCRPKNSFSKQFVGYFLMSQTGGLRQLNEMQKGATKAGLSLVDIKSVKVPLPDLSTQVRIVSEIEARLSEADAMETTIRQELVRAENLRQSILKQAFEGKLVTLPINPATVLEMAGEPEPVSPFYSGPSGDQLTLF